MISNEKTENYSDSTVEQLKTEFVLIPNSMGNPVLHDITGDIPIKSTESHLLKRASMLERDFKRGVSKSLPNLKLELPHIRQKLYDPSSAKKLKRLSTGFYDLNTYKAPEHKSIHAFSGSVNCPVLFDDYMTRLFPIEAERNYMVRWMARSVIQPAYKIRTAPLLRGGQGTGKSYLIDTVLSQLAGKHNVLNTSLGRITGQFNAAVATCTVCCLDETYSHKKSSADKLKKFVTDEFITITEKHVDSRQAKIYANIVILSNDKYPIYIEEDDRRYYVPQFIMHRNNKQETADFIKRFNAWLNEGGVAELYCYLGQVDRENGQNQEGFEVCLTTNSKSGVQSIDDEAERIGKVVDYLDCNSEVTIEDIKKLNLNLSQPSIVQTLKQQGFARDMAGRRGAKRRVWKRDNVNQRTVDRFSAANDEHGNAVISFGDVAS
ncbi:MAG: hypothetical protein ACJAW8_002030 [Oleispira sp.]|jgi:hypothetical protein